MKKILGTIVLCLLLCGNVYADVIRSIVDNDSLFLRCLDNSKNKKLNHMKYMWFSDNKSVWINYLGNIFEYKTQLFQNEKNYLILDEIKNNVILINKETGRLWNNKDKDWLEKNRYLSCSEIEESDLPN